MTWRFIGSRALDKNLEEFYGKKDIRVLDEGSASGRVVEHLIQNGIPAQNIDGIEISPEQVKIAIAKNLGAHFKVGDLRKDALPKNTYNVITRHMVDEHLDNQGLLEVSKNTLNALKPGGILVVVFTHPDKITASSGITEEGWFETTFPWKGPNGEFEKGQNYFRSKEVYVKVLEEAGFIVDSVEDWEIAPEAERVNKAEYEKYKKYGNIRLAVKAHRPA
jgi:SAM-dependent methyltransferase